MELGVYIDFFMQFKAFTKGTNSFEEGLNPENPPKYAHAVTPCLVPTMLYSNFMTVQVSQGWVGSTLA